MKQEEINNINNTQTNADDNRTGEYSEGNDRLTFMNNEENLMTNLEKHGYNEQFKVQKNKLVSLTTNKTYESKDVKAVNFYRFEGISDPDDMSILYAIETCDGAMGTLTDAYGRYSDEDTGEFMKQVEIEKKLHGMSAEK
ncbi:MAG: hypothetical protein EON98_08810 [Chitinophagaceae bacterium]|nr:MAG: hypothetical protein EON98_08810 [Chitinophagaceae bacterium]